MQVTNVQPLSGDDLTATLTVRWRLASDPDVGGSYTTVTNSIVVYGVTTPYLDILTLPPDMYVVHTYITADGDTTGTKVTVDTTVPV